MQQTFEHFLNTATVMKSSKPLSISICDYLKRFDSGLRHFLQYAYIGKRLKNPVKSRFSVVFCFSVPEQNGKILPLFCPFKIR